MVRSSVFPFEDHREHSCAGVFHSEINVVSHDQCADAALACYASALSDIAWDYFERHRLDPRECAMALLVQRIATAAAAATAFSRDPISGNDNLILIEATHGLGAINNDGQVDADQFVVARDPLRIVARRKGLKLDRCEPDSSGGLRLVPNTSIGFSLSDPTILKIAADVECCANHRGAAVDVELAVDRDGEPIYLQLRNQTGPPSAALSTRLAAHDATPRWAGVPLVRGAGSGGLICFAIGASVQGCIVASETIAVTDVPKLAGAAGLVVRHLAPTSHPAIHMRELGVPTLAIGEAFDGLPQTKVMASIECNGDEGHLYDCALPVVHTDRAERPSADVPVPVCLIASYPSAPLARLAQHTAIEGVHVRGESIVYDDVRIHPMALVRYDERTLSGRLRALVERKVAGYPTAQEFYISKFAERLAHLGSVIPPRCVVTLRLTDLRARDYRRLVGGDEFETNEDNPMLGLRGGARFVHSQFRRQLELELLGVQRAASLLSPERLQVLVPMVRSPEELFQIRGCMNRLGVHVALGSMVETMSSVFCSAELVEVADFFVVGPSGLGADG